MKRLILFLTLLVAPAFAYVDGSVLILDAGKTTLTVTNSGPIGGTFPVVILPGGHIWFSMPGYPQAGSSSACHDPCSVSLDMEQGRYSYWYTNSSGANQSAQTLLPVVTQPCLTAGNFVAPTALHGFNGYQICNTVTLGSVTVTGLRIWLNAFNLRINTLGIKINSNPEILLTNSPVVGFTGNGSACTITTNTWHGLSPGDVFQVNMAQLIAGTFNNVILNGSYTVSTVPSLYSVTAPCSVTGDYNTGNGGVGADNGMTISKTMFAADEKRFSGSASLSHEVVQYMVPIPNGQVSASATNTITFIWHGTGDVSLNGLAHGVYFDWALVQPDVEISQIVTSGTSATASTASQSYTASDTIIVRDAPTYKWRFNGKCVLTSATSTTMVFPWGCGMVTGTPGVAPYTTVAGTYTVPTSKLTTWAPSGHMYAARSLIPASAYIPYDPTSVSYGGNASNGLTVYQTTLLKDPNSWIPNNISKGVCADCHAKNGDDIKYFWGAGQRQSLIASLHRGLNESDAKDVAAYLSANTTPTPIHGRPWNGLNQPCPGLDSAPIQNWDAGCGEEWADVYDPDMRELSVPGGTPPTWTAASGGSYAQWVPAPSPGFNTHETPVFIPMPTWMDILPKTNPKDFTFYNFGIDFTTLNLYTTYTGYFTRFGIITLTGNINNSTTSIPVSDASKITNGDYIQIDGEYMPIVSGGGTSGATTLTSGTRGQCPTHGVNSCPAAASHTSGVFVSDYSTFLFNPSECASIPGNCGFVEQKDEYVNNSVYVAIQAAWVPYGGLGNAAGYRWPSQFGSQTYDFYLWMVAHKWEIMHRFWLENMLDQNPQSLANAQNARASAPFTRGWYTASAIIFDAGPHEAVGGATYYHNHTSVNQTNWNRETARIYHWAAILDPGNRWASGNSQIDYPYYAGFNSSLSQNRPAMNMVQMISAFQIQNTWAWSSPALPNMTLHDFRLNIPFNFAGTDLFTPEGEEGEIINTVLVQLADAIPSLSTSDWQTQTQIGTACPLSQVPNPSLASGQFSYASSCYQDAIAFGLALGNQYGVSGGTLSTIVTWANAVWTSSGHNFTADAAATCSYTGTPPYMVCTNF